jgi:hypothetical protein
VTLAKADVGLSNVDNTSDTNKPISSATQSALDGKAATSHTHTASAITDFTTAAAAAAPVQSVNGNTGTVTVAVPSASTATPQALGVAAAGTSNDFARADHVHALPTAADIGAAATSHTHAASAITSGTLDVARLPVGTGSTQVAAGNHTHVVADVTGAAASGSITTSGLTQSTARILGRTTASTGAVEEIQIGSGLSLSAGELSATGGSGSSIMQSIAVGFVLN